MLLQVELPPDYDEHMELGLAACEAIDEVHGRNYCARTGPIFTVPNQAKLTFYVYFDGEPGAGVHLFGLKVVEDAKTTSVWTKNDDLKGNTGGAWKVASVDLGKFSGKKVRLQWWFDVAVQFPKEDGHGLAIDEMRVVGACP